MKERSFARSLAETAYPSLAAYLPHLTLPTNPFLHKPDPPHPFFLNHASSFHFSSLFSGDLGKPGRRRKARTVFSDAQLAGLERRQAAFLKRLVCFLTFITPGFQAKDIFLRPSVSSSLMLYNCQRPRSRLGFKTGKLSFISTLQGLYNLSISYLRRMKHKKYLRKQVDGDDSENVSGDDKEEDESSALGMKFIKKEGDERDDLVNPSGLKRLLLVCIREIVKLRSRSRSGEGQVRVRKVKETKDLDLRYTLFLVFTTTTHPPPQTFFLAFKGSRQVRWT